VLVSASEWASIEETLYLLQSPANAKQLLESIARLDAGEGEEHELKVMFDRAAWAHYVAWQIEDIRVVERINTLLKEIARDPFRGTGKPEPLGQNMSGWWSRRIGWEQRLVYRVSGKGEAQVIEVAQCRYHY